MLKNSKFAFLGEISPDFKVIIAIFIFWRLSLILFAFIGFNILSPNYHDKFLGGGTNNYYLFPAFFGWGNFDGEHYTAIAVQGYQRLEQVFFPLYPLLISLITKVVSNDYFATRINAILTGMLISNISFLMSLFLLWKIVVLDFGKKIAFMTLLTLVVFPTSFYFAAVYNESLFLMVSLASIYFIRSDKWFIGSLLGGLSALTRIFGSLLFGLFIIYILRQKKYAARFTWILLVPFGLGIFMAYSFLTVGDPLAFFNLQRLVGEQRESGFTVIFQVYFRYLKMLLTTNIANPIFQTIVLEFFSGLLFFILPFYAWAKKMPREYVFYSLIGFLITTVQGSFSSTPRYVLVLFPSFIALGILFHHLGNLKYLLWFLSYLGLGIETILFLKGFWVA